MRTSWMLAAAVCAVTCSLTLSASAQKSSKKIDAPYASWEAYTSVDPDQNDNHGMRRAQEPFFEVDLTSPEFITMQLSDSSVSEHNLFFVVYMNGELLGEIRGTRQSRLPRVAAQFPAGKWSVYLAAHRSYQAESVRAEIAIERVAVQPPASRTFDLSAAPALEVRIGQMHRVEGRDLEAPLNLDARASEFIGESETCDGFLESARPTARVDVVAGLEGWVTVRVVSANINDPSKRVRDPFVIVLDENGNGVCFDDDTQIGATSPLAAVQLSGQAQSFFVFAGSVDQHGRQELRVQVEPTPQPTGREPAQVLTGVKVKAPKKKAAAAPARRR